MRTATSCAIQKGIDTPEAARIAILEEWGLKLQTRQPLHSRGVAASVTRMNSKQVVVVLGVLCLVASGNPEPAGLPMGALSTGEARRLLIARALAPDPGALLLDEPTTGLDLAARHRFLEILGKLAGLGKTLILVTHHIEEIVPAIDRVILLKEGRVFMDGPKGEVLRSGPVSDLFGLPVQVQRHGGRYAATGP